MTAEPPRDFYGSVELGHLAWQCPERVGYHVNADLFAVELVKNGTVVGPGQEGEVVITNLALRPVLLIRYAADSLMATSVPEEALGRTRSASQTPQPPDRNCQALPSPGP